MMNVGLEGETTRQARVPFANTGKDPIAPSHREDGPEHDGLFTDRGGVRADATLPVESEHPSGDDPCAHHVTVERRGYIQRAAEGSVEAILAHGLDEIARS